MAGKLLGLVIIFFRSFCFIVVDPKVVLFPR